MSAALTLLACILLPFLGLAWFTACYWSAQQVAARIKLALTRRST